MASYSGVIILRWVGTTGNSFNSDMAIDDIRVYDRPPVDLALIDITLASKWLWIDQCRNGFTVIIESFSNLPVTDIPVSYTINGAGQVNEVITDTLQVASTISYTFNTPADLSVPGTYTVTAWVEYPQDGDITNDTTTIIIENQPVIVGAPYFTSWENGNEGWTIEGTLPSWQVGIPNNVFINAAYHDTAAVVTNLTGQYNLNELSFFVSPCMDFTSLPADPTLSFALIYDLELNFDETWVESSIDGGLTWTKVGTAGTGINWYNDPANDWWEGNSGGWTIASNTLDGTAGQGDVRIRFVMSSDFSNNFEGVGIDSLTISPPPAANIGVTAITNPPLFGCGLGSTEIVTVDITNFGLADQAGFPVSYSLDGAAPVTEIYPATLASGATASFAFATTVDVSGNGNYDLIAWTDLVGDADITNDSASIEILNTVPVTTFPFIEDFESFSFCGANFTCGFPCDTATANGWIQDLTDGDDWRINFGPTGSTATGPNIDHNPGTPTGLYLYTEASGGCTNVTSNLVSPCMDISTLTNPHVDFYYHMFGADMGTMNLEVSTDGGVTWTTLWTQTGQVQTANVDPWEFVTVNLAAYSGTINLRWQGITGTGFNSDMGLDDIRVYDRPPFDVFPEELLSPLSDCGLGINETVAISLTSFSSSELDSIPVSYSINGGVPVTELFSDTLNPGETGTYTFITPADLSIPGEYIISIWTDLPTDGASSNDTATVTITNVPVIGGLPYLENWETGPGGWIVEGDNPSWELGFPNNALIDAPYSGANAWVTNLTGDYNDNELSFLESPCLDLAGVATDPIISFALNYDTQLNVDEGWLEYSVDGGQTWTTLGVGGTGLNWYNDLFNNWWEGNSGGWVVARNVMTGLAGQNSVQLRFVFSSNVTITAEGFGIDDLRIYEPDTNDVSIFEMVAPVSTCGLGVAEDITVVVENLGLTPQSNFPVSYSVNGGTPVVDTFQQVLAPGTTANFTFGTPADLSNLGTYTIMSWTDLDDDPYGFNDTLVTVVENIAPITTFPLTEDFETFVNCGDNSGCNLDCAFATANGWIQDKSDTDDWRITFGGTPSAGTGPVIDNNPGTPDGIFLFTEASGCNAQTSNIISPCMDVGGLANPHVNFYFHMFGGDMGTLNVDVSTDGGINWINLWTQTGQVQTANADPWELVSLDLSPYSGTIQLRWQAITGPGFESDMAIDDILIYDRPAVDLLAQSGVSPIGGVCGLTNNETVTMTLESFSLIPVVNVPVGYSINGGPAVIETFPDTLQPGGVGTYSFTTGADLSLPGDYVISVWTDDPADSFNLNDTIQFLVVNIPTLTSADLPYFIDWDAGQTGGWTTEGVASTWELGEPDGVVIDTAASGLTAWVTNLDGLHNPNEFSYLMSPCLDLSTLPVDPIVRFAIYYNTQIDFDFAWLEMTIDGEITWTKVGTSATGINWYNDPVSQVWEGDSNGWLVAEHELLGASGASDVRLRVVFNSNAFTQFDGIGIDNFQILPPAVNDAEVTAVNEYTLIPYSQAHVSLQGIVNNIGLNPLTNIAVDFEVFDGVGNSVFTDVGTLDTLVAGASAIIAGAGTFTPPALGQYYVQYTVSSDLDDDLTNNTFTGGTFEVTPTQYARDDGNINGAFGFGVGIEVNDNAELGQNFEVVRPDELMSITFYLDQPPQGDVIYATIYDTNPNGSPDNLLAVTTNYTITAADAANGVLLTLPIANGSITLQPGMYFVGLTEPAQSISVFAHPSIYTPGRTWVKWDFNPNGPGIWSNFEDFGFNVALYLRADFNPCGETPYVLDTDVTGVSDVGQSDGAIDLTVTGGAPPYTYIWDNGATTEDISALPVGQYCVTVTDLIGCQQTICDVVDVVIVSVYESIPELSHFNLMPNPTPDKAQLELGFSQVVDVEITLTDVLGRKLSQVYDSGVWKQQYTFDLTQYASGTYFVHLMVNGQRVTLPLILAKE